MSATFTLYEIDADHARGASPDPKGRRDPICLPILNPRRNLHMVRRQPVSHISQTMTSFNESSGFFARFASNSRRAFARLPIWGCQSAGSEGAPVMTTLIA